MSTRLVFQLVIGLLASFVGAYQVRTGKYPPGERVGFGAPGTPGTIRVLGGIMLLIGLTLSIMALAGVSIFHLAGR